MDIPRGSPGLWGLLAAWAAAPAQAASCMRRGAGGAAGCHHAVALTSPDGERAAERGELANTTGT
eukprot:14688194-Alexandrium_andersonii.AAC.1